MRTDRRLGRYSIVRSVGRGGFAEVFEVRDETLAVTVAAKVLLPRWADDDTVRTRFLREARFLRRIADRHVVAVFDVGETVDGRPYLVMPFAEGGSLASRIRERSPGQPTRARDLRRVVTSLAAGLRAVHTAGVVHHDLNPGNLLLMSGATRARDDAIDHDRSGELFAEEETLVIGDLGLAHELDDVAMTSLLGGTPRFMAPELGSGIDLVDHRADLYSATAIVHELLTGMSPPLPHEVEGALASLPIAWRGWCSIGMAIDPEDRFGDVDEWEADALDVLALDNATLVSAPRWDPGRCPFRGLLAFGADDADAYFGRERLVGELLSQLEAHNTVLVGGPSGSGKSSLVHAGVLGRLCASLGATVADAIVFTPGDAPCAALEHAMAGAAKARPPVIVIDQSEELFTQGASTAEIEDFVARLEALGDDTKIVFTLRADFYPAAARFPFLAHLIERHFFVGRMGRTELRQALTQAAHLSNVRLESGLLTAVLEDGGDEPGALPLVSHAMEQTWLRSDSGRLTLATYRRLGGVSGSLARTAEDLHSSLSPTEQERARWVWLRLVAVGNGATPDVRCRLPLAQLNDGERRLAERLIESRLAMSDGTAIELSHEAIIATWPRLVEWLRDERSALRTRDRLLTSAEHWEAAGRGEDQLLRGADLDAARQWATEHQMSAGPLTEEYLATSRSRQDRGIRRRRAVTLVMAGLALAAMAGGAAALVGLQRATRATEASESAAAILRSDRLAQVATSGVHDKELSMLLALEAVSEAETTASLGAVGALVDHAAGRRSVTVELGGRGVDVLWAPDDSWFATAEADGFAVLWNSRSGDRIATLRHTGGGLPRLALSPNGNHLVVGGRGAAIVWDVSAASQAASPVGSALMIDPPIVATLVHDGEPAVGAIAFSPNGGRLATGSSNGLVHLWSTLTWDLLGAGSHDAAVWDVLFDPAGAVVGSVSSDGTARLWSAESAAPLDVFEVGRALWAIDISPSGNELAVAGDGGAVMWSLEDNAKLANFHDDCEDCAIWDVEFDPTGTFVAAAGADQVARIFEVDSGEQTNFIPHAREVVSLAFHPYLARLLSTSKDGSAHLTDFELGGSRRLASFEHQDWVWRARWSADGRYVATVSSDRTAAVWEADSLPGDRALSIELGRKEARQAVVLDGHLGVLTLADDVVIIDRTTMEIVAVLAHDTSVTSLLADEPRRRLLIGLDDGTLVVWQRTDGEFVRLDLQPPSTPDERASVLSIIAIPERQIYAVASADHVHLLDAQTLTFTAERDHRLVQLLEARTNGTFASAASDGSLAIWSVDAAEPLSMFDLGETIIDLDTDGPLLAAATAGGVFVIDVRSEVLLATPELDPPRAVALLRPPPSSALSADDELIEAMAVAGGATNKIVAWNARTGEPLWTTTFGDRVDEIQQLDDGSSLLVLGSGQGSRQIISSTSGEHLLIGPDTNTTIGTVSADQRSYVEITEAGTVAVYGSPATWVATACRSRSRALTSAERESILRGVEAATSICAEQ